jgi:hypothetical protein
MVAAAFMTPPASAGKMNGKPGGGRNSAHYDASEQGHGHGETTNRDEEASAVI